MRSVPRTTGYSAAQSSQRNRTSSPLGPTGIDVSVPPQLRQRTTRASGLSDTIADSVGVMVVNAGR